MSILTDAYNLICAPNNPMGFQENFVFLHSVPEIMEDDTKSEDAPILVKITHLQNARSNFASNHSNSLSTQVQIQVWYNVDDALADSYDNLLNDYMENNSFYSTDASYIAKDPDVEKLYLTAKFRKTKF
ncbi:DUF806 family protein [Heyndrickxia acidicola]|uniref:DUF806 family protein n=1 Tax=Heyndrickxia acidicola TaxID=209389 RepID=A0ABU6MME1_9BACI|nr:DUF806 family protein [Heyndrickxia acidicola]MED1205846.1 DUF806 family protein [Heyndrickxia acidicola]